MVRTTRTKGESTRNVETEGGVKFKTASELGNKVNDIEITNIRKFKDHFGNKCCYFSLNLGFITIYTMLYLVDRKGNGYVIFPKEFKDKKVYSTGYIDENLSEFIVEEIENNYL